MRIAFFGTKDYDEKWFKKLNENYGYEIKYLKPKLSSETLSLANGYDAVCTFVDTAVTSQMLKYMKDNSIKLLLLRCAGYNNVDLQAAKENGIIVLRVPAYSPEAVAEHAMTLAMAANRRIHKAYNRVRDNNYSLSWLNGITLYGKTAGIIGTGKIGSCMARICKGIGMEILLADPYPDEELAKKSGARYVSIDELIKESDLISLHCPLTNDTENLINKDTIASMKDGVILVNTSRGGLINTQDLINGIKANKFHAVALDVYKEEDGLVFDDMSNVILETTITARLLSFPNVILTSHQAFLTNEALCEIAGTTLENVKLYENGQPLINEVK